MELEAAGTRKGTGYGGGVVGVLLVHLGGAPDVAAVAPYLRGLFSDRDVARLLGGGALQRPVARLMAMLYAPRLRKTYACIGGHSPILHYTRLQARGVETRLRLRGRDAHVVFATRYLQPTVDDALATLRAAGLPRIVVVTLHPQYSAATTGAILGELRRAVHRCAHRFRIDLVDRWHGDPGYLDVVAARVREGLQGFPEEVRSEVTILFCAHSVPEHLALDGDPYLDDVDATLQGVLARLPSGTRHRLAMLPGPGPLRWIGPETCAVVKELGHDGTRFLLCAPLSFVTDHIETLYEIDLVLRQVASQAGIVEFRRAPALNDDPRFIDVLANLVERRLSR
ncbi:MAG: ferrochelatase [Candidatus Krumholzibacteriia bacterium]